jgi:hypothetical protein
VKSDVSKSSIPVIYTWEPVDLQEVIRTEMFYNPRQYCKVIGGADWWPAAEMSWARKWMLKFCTIRYTINQKIILPTVKPIDYQTIKLKNSKQTP